MIGLRRLDAPAPFELWLVDLDEAPTAAELDDISDRERERASRFVFARDRVRYLSSHCALRAVLARRTGVAAKSLRFAEGAEGKPYLLDDPSLPFNLSHSQGVAMIALADRGEIGVDLEILRPMPDALALAERNYTAAECAELAGAEEARRDASFLSCWTRKEACLKAIGSGLSIAPETFEAGVFADDRVVGIPTPSGRRTVKVQSVREGAHLIGALAQVL